MDTIDSRLRHLQHARTHAQMDTIQILPRMRVLTALLAALFVQEALILSAQTALLDTICSHLNRQLLAQIHVPMATMGTLRLMSVRHVTLHVRLVQAQQ
jgi:hypothetical protein